MAYNYPSTDPFYSIRSVITTPAEYGILAGPAFSCSMVIMVLIAGRISDSLNRKFMLGLAIVCWSSMTFISSYA